MPAAGFELHTIAVEGLSRSQPAARAARAGARAAAGAAARARAARSARAGRGDGRRRLRGGRRSALAALTLRVPLVLTEADSHLGLTNRLLAPFARRVCLAFPLPGRDGSRYRVTGRPIPAAVARPRDGARALRHRAGGDVRAGVRRLAGRALDQPGGRSRRSRARPFTCCTSAAAATTRSSRRASCLPTMTCASTSTLGDFAEALAAADLVVARAGGLGVRDRRARAAGDPGALPARRGRPPERERALDGARRARRS